MFNRGRNSDKLLEKHFGLSGLVSPKRNDNFDSESEEEEKVEFEPPPEIQPDILSRTPIIRMTTPIKKKDKITLRDPEEEEKEEEKEFLEVPEKPDIFDIPTMIRTPTRSPIRSPAHSPVVDISDEDEVNDRIFELIGFAGNQNYERESKKVKEGCLEVFKIKFDNLRVNYPDRKITMPDTKNLNRLHKAYHSHIKAIYVDMNLGQIQLGYIMGLMAIEFLCIKAFGIPMAGFTKMELKRMYRYNHLMIELGENFYEANNQGGPGGPKSPLEWRMFTSFAWNIVIFMGLKFLSKYIGGEQMTDMVRGAVDKLLDNPVTVSNIENGTAQMEDMKTDSQDGIGSLFEGILSGGNGGGDLVEMIANMGTSFTKKMENTNKEKKASKSGPKKKRVIFTE